MLLKIVRDGERLGCMKTLPAVLASLVISLGSTFAAAGWQTDYKAALAEASKSDKLVLLDFTGSDWCGWCIKLDKETFSKPEFKEFAAKNLVLVEVDFPNNKPQSDALKKQNEELQTKFGVDGFPTLVLVDGTGKEVARNVGYLPGGPEGFIAWVKKAKK